MSVYYITILAMFATAKSSKILVVVPTPSISHQVVFRPMIQELINRDHEVTVITADPMYPQGGSPNNLKEIDLHHLSYSLWLKTVKKLAKIGDSNLTKIREGIQKFTLIFFEQLKEKTMLKLLKDTTIKFDLLILQNFVAATLILSHVFKAPVIIMSSFGALPGEMKMIGSQTHPFLYPTHYQPKLYNLTIWEKIFGLYVDAAFTHMRESLEVEDDILLKNLPGIDAPKINKLKDNVHMLFLNIHPIWIHNQPIPSSVVYTWGISKLSENILPQALQTYLDSSKHGVIYVSFGSLFKTSEIPPAILNILIKVFSRLPYDILWKWDADVLPGKSENIKISKWVPQSDVLGHRNLKLFITHGGLTSTTEAINAGVPLIGIPQFGDQEYNTEKYKYFCIGMKLSYISLNIEDLETAIRTIFENYNSYKKNMIRLRTLIYDQPKPALEHVTWWIEYVLRHGGVRHLRAPAANMYWAQYYELELVLLVLTGLIVIGIVFLVITFTYLRNILRLIKMRTKKPNIPIKHKSINVKK